MSVKPKFKLHEVVIRKTIPLVPMIVHFIEYNEKAIIYSLARHFDKPPSVVVNVREERLQTCTLPMILECKICQ